MTANKFKIQNEENTEKLNLDIYFHFDCNMCIYTEVHISEPYLDDFQQITTRNKESSS